MLREIQVSDSTLFNTQNRPANAQMRGTAHVCDYCINALLPSAITFTCAVYAIKSILTFTVKRSQSINTKLR